MERAVPGLEIGEKLDQRRIGRERAVRNRLVDARQFLVNDAARTEVQVADFAVAHLPGGQADVLARGAEAALREIFVEVFVKGKFREERRIALGLRGGRAFRADAPTVTDNKSYRFHRRLELAWLAVFRKCRARLTRKRHSNPGKQNSACQGEFGYFRGMEKSLTEKERMREYLENWKVVSKEIDRLKTIELQALTEEESAEQFNGLDCDSSLYWIPEESRTSSGLVEQQRIFAKGHKREQSIRRSP